MNQHSYLDLRRMSVIELLFIGMAIYWATMMPAVFGTAHAKAAATQVLLLPAIGLMYWVASNKMYELTRAAAVLRQLSAPHLLWRDMCLAALRYTGFTWLFLASGCSLQMALPASGVSAVAGAAIMSLVALAALGRSLSAMPRVLDIGLALLALPVLLLSPGALLAWFGNLPVVLLAGITVAFPVLLLLLARRWRSPPPRLGWEPAVRAERWVDVVRTQLNRFTMLPIAPLEANPSQAPSNFSRMLITALPVTVMLITSGTVFQVNGQIDLVRFALLMTLALLLTTGLAVRDMHWRTLLAPGGLKRGRLGLHIWVSTMFVQGIVLLVGVLFAVAVIRFTMNDPWPVLERMLSVQALLPLEIAFATALAVTLRALPHFGLWGTATLVLVNIVVYLMWGLKAAEGPLLTTNVYIGAMVAATVLLLLASNRLWTLRKLTRPTTD
jgi:hypothetical protein